MFSIGMFKPTPFKNSNIAALDSAGLAVSINWSLVPNFLALAKALSNKGPFLPSTTLLNSEKSKV